MQDPPCTYFLSLRYDRQFRGRTLREWTQRVASAVAIINGMSNDKLFFAYFEAELMALAVWTVVRAPAEMSAAGVANQLHITACKAVLHWREFPPSTRHYHPPLTPLTSRRRERYLRTPYARLSPAERAHLIRAVLLIRLVVCTQ